MTEDDKRGLTERSNALRLELKIWEKEFAAGNDGKKASREDIKKNPSIAQKYKDYNRTRDILSGKIKEDEPPRHTPRKRKRDEGPEDVSKRVQIMRTPSKTGQAPWEVDPYLSPSVMRQLFSPSKKTVIGPTPQKDGQVLGLFDLLQAEESPSKSAEVPKASTQATPRKSSQQVPLKAAHTPSSNKRSGFNKFSTPSKNPNIKGLGGTPSSISKLQFGTPSFLRRAQLPAITEGLTFDLSPQMVRVPRKPLVRGLSSMLAGLRKLEEDAAEEDLDALRDMEDEWENPTAKKVPSKAKPKSFEEQEKEELLLVKDSQPHFPLGGFDDEAKYDSEPDEPLSRDGPQPALRVYKKKGQKRTTRRVNLKPVRSKPASKPSAGDEEEDEEANPDAESSADELTNAALSHFNNENDDTSARNYASDSSQEYTASEGGTRYPRAKKKHGTTKTTTNGENNNTRKGSRKVTAVAGQNFKRLKLRNSGANGGKVGGRGRFGRRR